MDRSQASTGHFLYNVACFARHEESNFSLRLRHTIDCSWALHADAPTNTPRTAGAEASRGVALSGLQQSRRWEFVFAVGMHAKPTRAQPRNRRVQRCRSHCNRSVTQLFYLRMRLCASFGFGGVAVVKRRSHEAVDCFEPLRHFLHGWMIVRERRTEALDLVGTRAAPAHAHIVSVQQDLARTSPHLAALYTPLQWSRRSCARVPSIFRTAGSGRRARRHLPRFAPCCSFPIGSSACLPASRQINEELLSHC